jgi:quinol monooxygenase YgiN
MYTIVWRFTVKAEHTAAFTAAYGPQGAWAALFRQHAGYVRTDLLRDTTHADVFLTLDHWVSEAAFQDFEAAKGPVYAQLDQQFEALTVHEERLGTITR